MRKFNGYARNSFILSSLRRWARHLWLIHGILMLSLIWPSNAVPVRTYELLDGEGNLVETRQYEDWNNNENHDNNENSWILDSADSDGDGLVDARELVWATDPYNPDTDYDGITDGDEIDYLGGPAAGFDPSLWDTNVDGYSDHDAFYGFYGVNYSIVGAGYSYYDWDGDSYKNHEDSHPFDPNLYSDEDGDGYNLGEGPPVGDPDSDGDGYVDSSDSHPSDYSLWADWNYDGYNDGTEPVDSDGDGYLDSNDSHIHDSTRWNDWDNNGYNDDIPDSDQDGHPDTVDSHPNDPMFWDDWNNNGHSDAWETQDGDSDGHLNLSDSHPDNPSLWNDWNNNGTNDADELDEDGDGWLDYYESHPGDASLWNDWNYNGVNDDMELDPDGDGHYLSDTHPNDPNLWDDWNNDGYNDSEHDSDNDGVVDANDSHPQDAYLWSDHDFDSLNAEEEAIYGTDPQSDDTDQDGLRDNQEILYITNPLVKDTDGDGLTDFEELIVYASIVIQGKHLDPRNPNSVDNTYSDYWMMDLADSDGDGIPNSVENSYQGLMNPNEASDAMGDLDADGISNLAEYYDGSRFDGNIQAYDYDRDGMTDVQEDYWNSIQSGTMSKYDFNDSVADPDGDGVLNFEEMKFGLNPLQTETHTGFNDLVWINQNKGKSWTDPLTSTDADGDGIPNNWEHRFSLDVRDPGNAPLDIDGDTLSILGEYQTGRHPRIRDYDSSAVIPSDVPSLPAGSTNVPYNLALPNHSTQQGFIPSFNLEDSNMKGEHGKLTPWIKTYKKEDVTVSQIDVNGSAGWQTAASDPPPSVTVTGPDNGSCRPVKEIPESDGELCACHHGTADIFVGYVEPDVPGFYAYLGLPESDLWYVHQNGGLSQAEYENAMATRYQAPDWEYFEGRAGNKEWHPGSAICSYQNGEKISVAYMKLRVNHDLPVDFVGYVSQSERPPGGEWSPPSIMEVRIPAQTRESSAIGGVAPAGGELRLSYVMPPGAIPPAPPVPLSLGDSAGSRYRKVALNGAPRPDSKPQVQNENGENAEETYIDPFLSQLRHSISDVYVEAPGSLLPLAVKRSVTSDSWNNRSGLVPEERPNQPFGPGWSSNLCSYVRFENGRKATVYDEEGVGSTYYFIDSGWKHDRQEHRDVKTRQNVFTASRALPASYETYTDTLPRFTSIVLNKKFGTVCTYEMVPAFSLYQAVGNDRLEVSTDTSVYTYARLVNVKDRLGNELKYEYPESHTIIPSRIHDPRRPGHQVTISQNAGRITSVRDPSGNVIEYSYDALNSGTQNVNYTNHGGSPKSTANVLTAVRKDGGVSVVEYKYQVDSVSQWDAESSKTTLHNNLEMQKIKDENGNEYTFTYLQNEDIWYWDGTSSKRSYGVPMKLTGVTLPDNLGQVTINSNRSINPANGNFIAGAANFQTSVSWTGQGDERTYVYTFSGAKALSPTGDVRAEDNPNAVTYAFTQMDILAPPAYAAEPAEARTETFKFLPSNSMALYWVKDRTGRITEFKYPPDGYDDPSEEWNYTSPGSSVVFKKYFSYDPETRILSQVTDQEGGVTTYEIGTGSKKGLRLGEQVQGAAGVPGGSKKTWGYDLSALPGMLIEEKVEALPSDVQKPTLEISPPVITTFTVEADTSIPGWWRSISAMNLFNGQPAVIKTVTDFNNNKRSITDARDLTTLFEYDAQNRLKKVLYPDGMFKEMSYDAHGNIKWTKDEAGTKTFFEYDALHRLKKTTVDLNRNGAPDIRYTAATRNAENEVIYDGDLVTEVVKYNSLNQALVEVDARGVRTLRRYDVLGRPTKLVVNADASDVEGTLIGDAQQLTTFEYKVNSPDANNNKEAGGSVFDVSSFKPVRVTDPMGNQTRYTFDGLHRCIKTKRADGNILHTTYDRIGRATSVSSAAPSSWVPTLAEDGRMRQVSAQDTVFITQTYYDACGNVTKTILPDSKDEASPPTLKAEVTYFTPSGKQWKQFTSTNLEVTTSYNDAGLAVRTEGPAQPGTAQADRPVTTLEHDLAGNVVKSIDPLGRATLYRFDRRNRQIRVVMPQVKDGMANNNLASPIMATEYDSLGRVLKTSNPLGHESSTVYDAAGRVTDTVDAEGKVTRYSHDPAGNIVQVTDAKGNTTTNIYDHFGRLVNTGDAENQHTTFAYDKNGNRILMMDARAPGPTWASQNAYMWAERWRTTQDNPATDYNVSFRYDQLNRQVRQTFANSNYVTSQYTLDRKVSDTNAKGVVTIYEYDLAGRIIDMRAPSGAATGNIISTRTYHPDKGLITQSIDRAAGETSTGDNAVERGVVTNYSYDQQNRLRTEDNYGKSNLYGYDLAGNQKSKAHLGYNNLFRGVVSSHDALNRLEALTDNNRTLGYTADDKKTEYGYDLASRGVWQKLPNGQVIKNEYDKNGRLRARNMYKDANAAELRLPIVGFSWSYDAVGNVLSQTENWYARQPSLAGITTRYRTTVMSYDKVNRLKTEAISDSGRAKVVTTYHYDAASNKTGKDVVLGAGIAPEGVEVGYWIYTYNARNQLTKYEKRASPGANGTILDGAAYSYDADGNRTHRTVYFGPSNATYRTTEYIWDNWNRLASVKIPVSSSSRRTYHYRYDHRMRRRTVAWNTPGSAELNRWTAVVFSGGVSVAEYTRTSAASNIGDNSVPDVEYLRGPDMGGGVGGLLWSLRSPVNASQLPIFGTTSPRYNLSNGRGDIVAQSDQNGDVTWTASYEAFGKRTKETGTNADKQRANSKDEDPTGLLNEGFRYRDIETGVWLSRDPAGFVDGPNLYAYVKQNPWTSFDPDGLESRSKDTPSNDDIRGAIDGYRKLGNRQALDYQAKANKDCFRCHPVTDIGESARASFRKADFLERILRVREKIGDDGFGKWTTGGAIEREFGRETNEYVRSFFIPESGFMTTAKQRVMLDTMTSFSKDVVWNSVLFGLSGPGGGGHPALTKQVLLGGAYESRGGALRMGAFNAETNTIALGKGGHFDGAAEAGMKGIKPGTHKGLTVFEKNGVVFWANDSMSLSKAITSDEALNIQRLLQTRFEDKLVQQVKQIGDVLK